MKTIYLFVALGPGIASSLFALFYPKYLRSKYLNDVKDWTKDPLYKKKMKAVFWIGTFAFWNFILMTLLYSLYLRS